MSPVVGKINFILHSVTETVTSRLVRKPLDAFLENSAIAMHSHLPQNAFHDKVEEVAWKEIALSETSHSTICLSNKIIMNETKGDTFQQYDTTAAA